MPSSLVIAFRQQFPEGSILSEVLSIQDGLYVVRVSVVIEGTPLSQALGANRSLELAEDIACNRALERLALAARAPESNFPPGPGSVGPTQESRNQLSDSWSEEKVPVASVPSPQKVSAQGNGVSVNSAAPQEKDASQLPEVSPTAMDNTQANSTDTPEPYLKDDHVSDPSAGPPMLKLATPPGAKTSPEPSPTPEPTPESWLKGEPTDLGNFSTDPVDLSDIIAQTDVELQRLGWDVHQGREFLEKTYGKRSRHDLTDEELLEFLLYLESQPAPLA